MIENNKKYASAPEEHKEQARKDRDKEAFAINKDRGNLNEGFNEGYRGAYKCCPY